MTEYGHISVKHANKMGGEQTLSQSIYEIAWKAGSLLERIRFPLRSPTHSPEQVKHILARWNKAFSQGHRSAFLRRLSWDGLSEDQVRQALSTMPDSSERLPDWIRTLEAALDQCPGVLEDIQQGKSIESVLLAGKEPVVFPELWLPFLRVARERVIERAGSALLLISEEAWNTFQRRLLLEMSGTGGLAAFQQFASFRNARFVATDQASENSRLLYGRFVESLLEKNLIPLFEEYSVLASQICRLVDTWADAVSELLLRLKKDREAIAQVFNQGLEPGQVTEIRPALSDRHHGGRQVIMLTFSFGMKLIYKPRNVEQEYAYNQLITWMAREGLPESLPALKILKCDNYGWVEFIAQSPCQSGYDVERYYRQAGVLVCLIYVLCGDDCHMDNLVATRNGPVLVDVESLARPLSAGHQAGFMKGVPGRDYDHLKDSVLATGLLDSPVPAGPPGMVRDGSGLRGVGGGSKYHKKRVWRHCNTDAMCPEYETTPVEPMQNLLLFKGEIQYPEHYTRVLVDGFTRAYRFILSHRGALLAPDSPLNSFADSPVRIIFRPSNDYAVLLVGLAKPKYQRDGLDRSIVLEGLGRLFQQWDSKPELWYVFTKEREALEDLDIPHFTIPASTDSLVERLNLLNESDLEHQTGLIRAMLQVFQEDCGLVEPAQTDTDMWSAGTLSEKELVNQAEQIGRMIQARAVQRDDGTVTWIPPAYMKLDGNFQQDIYCYLYNGASGVALFLAALARITGKREYEDLAATTCKSITRSVENDYVNQLIECECLGACTGLGSIVYTLVTIGRILGSDAYLDLAKRIAALITQERISADRQFDVEGGSAGCLLALLALYNVDKNPVVLKQALNCALHLLDNSHVREGSRGWKNDKGLMLAGFAHGASGIALALFRLYQITGNRMYFNASQQAFQYEKGLFSKKRGNWPIVRKKPNGKMDTSLFMTAWCNGAPGIALARIGALEVLDDDRERTDLECALRTTAECSLGPLDYLCCGNFGRADILLTAGIKLDRPDLVKTAHDRVIQVIRRAQAEGHFSLRLKTWENRCFKPSFFRGLSGIGYTLLRMAYPECLPSILLFDN